MRKFTIMCNIDGENHEIGCVPTLKLASTIVNNLSKVYFTSITNFTIVQETPSQINLIKLSETQGQ